MRTFDKKIGEINYKIEDFDSVLEMYRVNSSRASKQEFINHNDTLEQEGINKNWTGVKSVKEAYDLLTNGWEKATEKVSDLVDKVVKTGTKEKMIQENNVYGFVPNVPLSIMNVPNSMINIKRTVTKSKVITIVYDNGASGCVSSEDLIKAGTNIVETIINLESSGYRVNVKVINCFCDIDDNIYDISMVNVKNANQPINLKKMMFPLAHSAWLRVVGFDWEEKSPISHWIYGKGKPYYVALEDYGAKRDDLHKILGGNVNIITYKDAIKGTDYIKQQLLGKEVA